MKIRKITALLLVGFSCAFAEPPPPPPYASGDVPGGRFGGRGNRPGADPRSMMSRSLVFAETEISRAFPNEFAEVEVLREKYETALAALAERAGVELPESRDAAYRELRKKNPEGFAVAVEKIKTSPREGMVMLVELARKEGIDLYGGRRDGVNQPPLPPKPPAADSARSFDRPDLSVLRRKYPQEMKEYDDLRVKDPAKAREKLLGIIEKDRNADK